MNVVLTLDLPEETANFLTRRAAEEHLSLAALVAAMVERDQAFEAEANRPLAMVAAPELVGQQPDLLRDADETDAEFAARQHSFSTLLGLP